MDFHEISELDQKSLQKQHIEKSELLNIIYYDSAGLNFWCANIFADSADFGHILAFYLVAVRKRNSEKESPKTIRIYCPIFTRMAIKTIHRSGIVCSIYSCDNRSSDQRGKSFFRFPKEPEM